MKFLSEGLLREYSSIIIETDQKNPEAILKMTATGIKTAEGYVTKIIYINQDNLRCTSLSRQFLP